MRGLSLLETIFSLFLLAMLFVFLLNLFPSALYAVRCSEDRMEADEIAQSTLDAVLSSSFGSLTPMASPLPPTQLYGIDYTGTLEILPVPGSDDTVVKALKVTVQWKRGNAHRQVVHEVYDLNIPR